VELLFGVLEPITLGEQEGQIVVGGGGPVDSREMGKGSIELVILHKHPR
jgi:hypothetical protein